MPTITAAVITRNEQAHIAECLATLAWADERLVVDSLSDDATVHLAQAAGARVVLHAFDTYARQRNYTLDQATGDWVFFVDADERVPQALAEEVRRTVEAAGSEQAGYWVPRHNEILGRWVRHAGWWPDAQLRLLRHGRARYDEERDPHELVALDGAEGHLIQHLQHINYTSIGQLFSKQDRYAKREAAMLSREGVKPLPHRFVTLPGREFIRRFITLEGYKEGPLGLLLACVMAWYCFRVYVHLWRLGRST
ncbi:MAG: glycosyltransferase family 2 protein [Dehalococcoidia bacterium]|nr:glycosyltransferase family 2 protein [Dehalococcoidia bacterium]